MKLKIILIIMFLIICSINTYAVIDITLTSDDAIWYMNCEVDTQDQTNATNQGGEQNFTVTGAMTYTPLGAGGGGTNFCDGTAGATWLYYATGEEFFQTGSDDYTFCEWIDTTGVTAETVYFSYGANSAGNKNYLEVDGDATNFAVVSHNDETNFSSGAKTGAMDYICFTWKDATKTAKVYENGVLKAEHTEFSASPNPATHAIWYGSYLGGDTGRFNDVDEVVFFNGTLTDAQITTMYNNDGVLQFVPPNTEPELDINSPDNDTITNVSPIEIIFNATDIDADALDCHLSDSNGNVYDSIYTITQTVNQTLNATVTENNYVFQIDCDDGTINKTDYRTIIYDVTDADTIFYVPSVNSTVYENDFYYLIWVNDTNLYSSNVTIFNITDNAYVYENYTEDYNVTNQNLSDFIELPAYDDGDYEICIDVCDGHTDNIFNKEYEYTDTSINIDGDIIQFQGDDFNNIIVKEKYDRIEFDINMEYTGTVEIILPKEYQKVSTTKYNGHFVNSNKKIWFDTTPFGVSYYFYDENNLHIFLNLNVGINTLNSIGQLNCDKNCLNFFIDEHEPDITYQQYLQNDNISYNTSLSVPFIYQVTHEGSPSIKIVNCTLYVGVIETGTGTPIIIKNETQFGTPNIAQNTNQTITTWIADYTVNMTWDYHLNCSDSSGHESHDADVIRFYTETYQAEIIIPPAEPLNDTSTTTPDAIDKIRRPLVTFILILIWVIFLGVSYLFGGSWFFFFTGIFGVLIGIEDTFNNTMSFRIMFIVINLFIILYTTFIYDGGVASK